MKKLKDIVKKNPQPAGGTNSDPGQLGMYSAKHNISETAVLDRYLKAMGVDPRFVSKDTKVSHSKSNLFKKWSRDHANIGAVKEDMGSDKAVGEPRSTGADSPTMQRQARLKKSISNYTVKPVRTDVPIKKEGNQVTNLTPESVELDDLGENRVIDAVKKAWKSVSNFDNPSPKYDGQTRRRQALKQKLATDKKKVSEAKEGNYGGDYQQSVLNLKAKAEKKPVDMKSLAARMQASYAKDKVKKEEVVNEMDGNGSGRDGSNRKSMKTYGSRDSHTSSGPDIHHGPESMMTSKQAIDKFHKQLDKLVHSTFGKSSDEKKMKEEVESLDEISPELQHRYFKARYAQHPQRKGTPKKIRQGMDKVINRALRRNTISTPGAEKDFKDQEARRGIGHVRDHVENDSSLVENTHFVISHNRQTNVAEIVKDKNNQPILHPNESLATHRAEILNQSTNSEHLHYRYGGKLNESMLDKVELAKVADVYRAKSIRDFMFKEEKEKPLREMKRMIKIRKKLKEDMYDHEKEDKSVKTYGKKPKFEKADKDDSIGEKKPQAAAVLSGGTTLTGSERDVVEIDPMMRNRPGQPDVTKKDDKKKDDKKQDGKKDK